MNDIASNRTLLMSVGLAALMAATRDHHFASALHLPDASWAAFFLVGFYVRERWALPALLAVAALSDYLAITGSGVDAFCVSPAYVLLAPAYGALWLAGRWYGGRYRFHADTLPGLTLSVLGGALACELLSSGGFYLFSGRFAELSLADFGAQLARYFPPMLAGMALYIGVAAIAHTLLGLAGRTAVVPAPIDGP
ncbi:hypothetical protein [Methylomagnum sp.]